MKIIKYITVGFVGALILALILFAGVSLLASFANLLVGTFAAFLQMLGLGTLFAFGIAACMSILVILHQLWFE